LATSPAETLVVKRLLFTNVAGRLTPFQRTTAPFTKSEPSKVNVKPGLPAGVEAGDKLVKVGGGFPPLVMVKGRVLEFWPSGLVTPTVTVPALATSAAETLIVKRPLLRYVAERLTPFQVTTAPLTKFEPFNVRVKGGLPAEVVFGVKLVKIGAAGAAVIVKGSVPEIWASGLVTPTFTVAAAATSAAETLVVKRVLLKNVAGRLTPFQVTTAPSTKFVPSNSSVKAGLPAEVVSGIKWVKFGAVGLTVVIMKVRAFEV
jgi:hypothetical protein